MQPGQANANRRIYQIGVVLGLAAFLLLFTVLIHRALNGSRIGMDFYIFWRSGRAFLIDHISPYSHAVTAQIQQDVYRRAALPGEDHLAMAYPFYSLFGLLPALLMEFDWAISFWYALTVLATVLLLLVIFPARAKVTALSVLLLFPVSFGLVMGNFAIPVTLALLAFLGLICLKGGRSAPLQITCGVLLAWATLKPQFIWLPLIFILLYALKHRLTVFLVTFFATGAVLLGLSFLFLPSWLAEWLQNVRAYAAYQSIRPVLIEQLDFVLPESIAVGLGTLLLAVLLLSAAWLLLRWWQGKLGWLQTVAWLGVVTFLFHPHGMSYEQLPSLIPMILWLAQGEPGERRARLFFWIGALVISWLPFLLAMNVRGADGTPILWTAAWAAWFVLRKQPQPPLQPARA